MATSSYSSTEETTNTNRACRLLLGPCTDELRDVLRHHVPPSTFPQVIVQRCIDLPRLTVPQRNLILPRNNSYTGNYNDMDISLLCILLRNICSIPPHSKGWGNDPDPTDRSLSANIERIRIARNHCVHSSSPVLSNADFNIIWSTVRSTVMDLDSFLNNGNQYEREVDFLRYETMDPLRDRHYVEELRKQAEEDAATREIVHGLKRKVEEIETGQIENKNKMLEIDGKVEEIETGQIENKNKMLEIDGKVEEIEAGQIENKNKMLEIDGKVEEIETGQIENKNKMLDIDDILSKLQDAVIPPNVKAICENDVLHWEEDDKFFCESHNFLAMLEKVKKKHYVMFVGVPGSGKTATAHHIALMLQQEGYEIVPIKDIRKIEDYCDPKNPQVFVIDDVVGVFGLQETKLNLLSDYKKRITNPIMPKSKTLMTCREAVYRKTIEESSSFFADRNNIILLHDDDNALTNSDKISLLKMYHIDVNLLSPASLTSTSKMFPYLCKLFSTEKKFRLYGSVFFENPVPCLLKELDEMEKQNKIQYVSLVLCMMNENKISEKILEEDENDTCTKNLKEVKRCVLRKCKVSSQTDNFRFVAALSEMEGTYTKICGTEYSFVHDSMFEIVAYHFGCQFPELILQFMSSNYIANYVKLHECYTERLDDEISLANAAPGESKQTEDNDTVSCESKQKEENLAVSGKNVERMESFDLSLRLGEEQFSMLAERLYRDVENMELYDVFMNNVLKQPKVCQAFIGVLMTKSNTELKSLFLSEQKDVSKVVSKRERLERESEKREEWSNEYFRQEVLVNDRGISESTQRVRVISWVVNYGHNQILQYILDQTELHKETVSELFMITRNCCNPDLKCITGRKINQHTPEQYRILLLSCYSGDIETVRIILKYVNENLINDTLRNSCDYCMWYGTPLIAACDGGYINIVKELLELGADANLQGQEDSPLTVACMGGYTCVVNELLAAGADVNVSDGYRTPLTAACSNGNMCVIKELLKAGADVNLHGPFDTPLTAASYVGHLIVVKELLEAGADVNLPSADSTPLKAACKGGHISVVKKLLEAGADVSLQPDTESPLTAACEGGHINVVKKLLEEKADVNLKGYCTPLTAACRNGHMSVVKKLLEMGADVNLQGENYGPLSAACKNGHMIIVKQLLEAGADVNLQCQCKTPLTASCEGGHLSVVKKLLEVGANVNPQGKFHTPLTAACKDGQMSVIKELLDAGADVNLKDHCNSPLSIACKGGYLSVVKKLLEAGANVNSQGTFITPLTAACEGGHLRVVEELLEAGADVNPQDQYETALTSACRGGHSSVVKELLKAGAIINPVGHYRTPMTAVCYGEHVSVMKELLQAGADINLQDKFDTPLTAACKNRHIRLIEELLEAGANVNLQAEHDTPLTTACKGGNRSVVKELIEAGAYVNLRGEDDTPLTAACFNGHLSVVKELVEAGAEINLKGKNDTPLTAACENGHLNIVQKLLKEGANVNPQGYCITPLTAACKKGHMSIVKVLLKVGADVNLISKYIAPLAAACKGGHISVVKELLRAGAQINLQGGYNTPLTAACEGGHMDVLMEMLEAGADVNMQDKLNTPLTAVCENGNISVVKVLLKAGADVNLQGEYNTPLTAGCEGGHMNAVKEILKAGANINLQCTFNTPLIAACKGGHMSIVKELLEAGADVNSLGKYNTPLTAACEGGHVSIVKELLEAGADVNSQDSVGRTPLYIAVLNHTKSVVRAVPILRIYGADSTICNDEGLSSLCIALFMNKAGVVKQLLKIENESQLKRLKLHLFDCLVDIRHSDLMTDSKDDVVMTQGRVLLIDDSGDWYDTILCSDCNVLKHLLDLGLNVNQWIQLYGESYVSDVRPLLFVMIDEEYDDKDKVEKVRILLEAGADVNVRVRCTEYDYLLDREFASGTNDDYDDDYDGEGYLHMRCVLDRKGISVLERTRRLLSTYIKSNYKLESEVSKNKRVLSEIKKHVRRYSV